MEQEKPFKTIEVIDAKTRQVCKVACMSCIRGHRTTSCGIPVCRSKIFWTVKRPGRPSNSCNCRFGATGGCKCVVARNACPHKSKKGEKRSGQCRCDEQGRYCCLIEPEQWDVLLALQKPYVEFFSTREALEARQSAATQHPLLPAAPFTSLSPQPPNGPPSLPPSTPNMQPVPIAPNNHGGYYQQSTTLTPRFGMMGVGAPMGSSRDIAPDVLTWNGQAPVAPRDFNTPFQFEDAPIEQGSCCQPATTPSAASTQLHQSQISSPMGHPHALQMDMAASQLHSSDGQQISVPTPPVTSTAPAFNFERLQADYFNYQFPSAICQNCGLNGCTCRNCPPVFQNFGTTSWAQCCGRKHAREVQPTPPPIAKKIPRTGTWAAEQAMQAPDNSRLGGEAGTLSHEMSFSETRQDFGDEFVEADLQLPPEVSDLDSFSLDHELLLTNDSALSEFLLSDIDRSARAPDAEDEPNGDGRGEGGGGGGCCCGG